MKPLDKVIFLQKSVNLNDSNFCKRYNLNLMYFKICKLLNKNPKEKRILELIKSINLDPIDFMDNLSTLEEVPKEGEHSCKYRETPLEDKNLIYEDFAREENGRYEEKD